MSLKEIWRHSKLREHWLRMPLRKNYRRLKRLFHYYGVTGIKYLMPGHFYLDYVEISITTRCNLQCADCALLMPYYEHPYDIDSETVIASIRKISECFDACEHFRLLGGETFLHPDLKRFIAEIPSEKCKKISIPTNATIVPNDPELYELLRKKRVTVLIGNYPAALETQEELIKRLEQERVMYEVPAPGTWTNYGKPIDYGRNKQALTEQFARCDLRNKSILNGVMYYCARYGHGYDLGIIDRKPGEYVDIFHNTTAQNRREICRLMWRHRPIEACKYCLRGTDKAIKIPRGK